MKTVKFTRLTDQVIECYDCDTPGDQSGEYVPLSEYEKAILKAIDDEPEYPGEIPDSLWETIRNDRNLCVHALRSTVRLTKDGIKNRWFGIIKREYTPRQLARRLRKTGETITLAHPTVTDGGKAHQ